MRRAILLPFVLALSLLAGPHDATAEKRVALVIGNAAYRNVGALANPANDASDIAAVLKGVGFEVIEGHDLSQSDMIAAIRRFSSALGGADVGLFFYAGHGLQVAGTNYLAPVDAELAREADLAFEAVKLDLVLEQMEREVRTALVFLDACRDNPMAENLARSMGTRSASIGRGLARIESGVGTFIAFATQPGNVALDGEGRNSPFATALIKNMAVEGKDLGATMIAVRNDVLAATAGKQVPWDHSSLTGTFFFKPAPLAPSDPSPAIATGDQFKTMLEALVKAEIDRREAALKGSAGSAQTSTGAPPAPVAETALEKPQEQAAATPGATSSQGAQEASPQETPVASEPRQAAQIAALPPEAPAQTPASSVDAAECERATAAIAKVDLADLPGVLIGGGGLYFASGPGGAAKEESRIIAAVAAPLLRDLAAPMAGELLNRIAAYLHDPSLSAIDFEKFNKLDHARAIAACEAALGQTSDDRWAYRLARAYFASSDAARAKPIFERLAAKGSADAKLGLALMYASGNGVALDGAEAARLLQSAGEAKNTTALLFLGLIRAFGFGVAADPDQAVKDFRQAAELGDPVGMLALGAVLHSSTGFFQDDTQAIEWLRKAAAQDYLIAMAALAAAYGKPPLRDMPEALRWVRKIADRGNPYGMLALGVLSAATMGGLDPGGSDWLRKVEDTGSAPAMLILGSIYSKGGPIAASETESKRLFQKVEDLGDPYALLVLAAMHGPNGAFPDQDEMKRLLAKAETVADPYALLILSGMHAPQGMLPDQAEANRLLLRLSEVDNETMLLILGLVHLGDGPLKDEAAAKRIFLRLAERGNIYAMGGLVFIYSAAGAEAEIQHWLTKIEEKNNANVLLILGATFALGTDGAAKNPALGERLLRKAAERDNIYAMVLLGAMHQAGNGITKDEAEAERLWRKAAEGGNALAMLKLGEVYAKGSVSLRDFDAAALWVSRALAKGDQQTLNEMRKNHEAWGSEFRMALQRRLQERGVFSGPINGEFDATTIAAIETLARVPLAAATPAP
jgi:uncharacterized caspase-like protein/TPR repeat protein